MSKPRAHNKRTKPKKSAARHWPNSKFLAFTEYDFVDGIHLVAKPRNNIKNLLMHLQDKILLRKWFLIETLNDQLKNICQIEHTGHGSLANFLTSMISILIAYLFLSNKLALNGDVIVNNQITTTD